MTLHRKLVCHFRLSGGEHLFSYRCIERPRLRLNRQSRGGRVLDRSYWVEDDPEGRYFDTLDDALIALDQLEALELAS